MYTIAEKLLFIILTGFSSSLFLLSLGFKRAQPRHRVLGVVFVIPLILTAAAFTMQDKPEAHALLMLTLPLLTLILILFSLTGFVKTPFTSLLIVFLLTFGAAAGIFISASYRDFLSGSMFLILSALAAAVLNTILLLIPGKRMPLFNWALYLNAAVIAASAFYRTSGQNIITFVFVSVICALFYIYFFKSFTREIELKLLQAEKKLGNLDRVLEKEIRKRTFEIEQVNRKLVDISRTDPLSKALTKSAITDIIENLINKKIKEFAVLMFDVDYFKDINDTYGHIVGDKCIKRLALTAKGAVREFDHIGRYGGDEFVAILPSLDYSQSLIVAERLRKKVEETRDPHFTVSIGISVFPEDGLNSRDLIAVADRGLYLSKEKGRNAVSHAR